MLFVAKSVKSILKEIFKQRGRDLAMELIENVREDMDQIFKRAETEFKNIWNSAVDEYYSYSPEKYIRHGNSAPGSGGSNLYNALHINLEMKGSHIESFEIDINSTAMDTSPREYIGKKHYSYGYIDSGDTVLENILNGNRFRGYDPYSVSANGYSGSLGTIYDQYIEDLNKRLQIAFAKTILNFVNKYR